MDPISLLHARPKAWLATSVLAPHAAAFATYLMHARYSAQSCGTYVASLAHLGRWMSQCCLPLSQLDGRRSSCFSTGTCRAATVPGQWCVRTVRCAPRARTCLKYFASSA
jgi:hypothetical protein